MVDSKATTALPSAIACLTSGLSTMVPGDTAWVGEEVRVVEGSAGRSESVAPKWRSSTDSLPADSFPLIIK